MLMSGLRLSDLNKETTYLLTYDASKRATVYNYSPCYSPYVASRARKPTGEA